MSGFLKARDDQKLPSTFGNECTVEFSVDRPLLSFPLSTNGEYNAEKRAVYVSATNTGSSETSIVCDPRYARACVPVEDTTYGGFRGICVNYPWDIVEWASLGKTDYNPRLPAFLREYVTAFSRFRVVETTVTFTPVQSPVGPGGTETKLGAPALFGVNLVYTASRDSNGSILHFHQGSQDNTIATGTPHQQFSYCDAVGRIAKHHEQCVGGGWAVVGDPKASREKPITVKWNRALFYNNNRRWDPQYQEIGTYNSTKLGALPWSDGTSPWANLISDGNQSSALALGNEQPIYFEPYCIPMARDSFIASKGIPSTDVLMRVAVTYKVEFSDLKQQRLMDVIATMDRSALDAWASVTGQGADDAVFNDASAGTAGGFYAGEHMIDKDADEK